MTDTIYDYADEYDLLFGELNLDFWAGIARDISDPILELVYRTGKIGMPLAETGFRVTGLDNLDAMLCVARAKSATRCLNKGFRRHATLLDVQKILTDRDTVQQPVSSASHNELRSQIIVAKRR